MFTRDVTQGCVKVLQMLGQNNLTGAAWFRHILQLVCAKGYELLVQLSDGGVRQCTNEH